MRDAVIDSRDHNSNTRNTRSFHDYSVPQSDVEPVTWLPHTDADPGYLSIAAKSVMVRASLNHNRWEYLNRLVNEEPVVRSPVDYDDTFDYFAWAMW